jgi:serine/threonine protein kinase
MDEILGQIINGYSIIEEIGQGGMSSVYRARPSQGKDVAIKILSPIVAQDRKFRTRFAREIAILRDLKHPNIVPILDHGQIDGTPYIVMPYAEHGTLHDVLGNGAFGPRRSARIVSGIAAGLSHAHANGIIHRDVKPSNILLDENGDALLSDFGFAHLHDSKSSLTGSLIIGTPAYMSPEQCHGESVDAKSDQYSLGIIIFQLSTGKLPYEAETPMGLVVKQINNPLPRPRYVNANVPDAIEDVLLKCLDKDPKARYPSVDDLNEDFQEAMLRSFDASTGRLKPDAISGKPVTKIVQKKELRGEVETKRSRLLRRALPALLLLAIPLTALAASSYIVRTDGAANLQATIGALSTQNSERLGSEAGEEQVSTAVAGTLSVMELAASDLILEATPTPTPTETALPTNTPVVEQESDESGGGVPPPVVEKTHTPIPPYPPTSTPIPSETAEPSATVEPTTEPEATETLVPTDPPESPIPPDKCKPPGHPQFACTPTPTIEA